MRAIPSAMRTAALLLTMLAYAVLPTVAAAAAVTAAAVVAAEAAGDDRSGARPRAWLHIGPPKTGTSTLQNVMLANLHVLERHGITYLGSMSTKGEA